MGTRSEHTELGEILKQIPTPQPQPPSPAGTVVTGSSGEIVQLTQKTAETRQAE
jgi:hypothetical protein